jgi:hypothetical protein
MTYFTTQFSKNQSEEPYQLFGNSLAPQTLSYVILNNLRYFFKKNLLRSFQKDSFTRNENRYSESRSLSQVILNNFFKKVGKNFC